MTRRTPLQRSLHFLDLEGLEDISLLHVVVAGNLNTALHSLANFLRVVFVTFQRFDRVRPHDCSIANDAELRVSFDRSLDHAAAGNGSKPADVEEVLDDGPAELHFLLVRNEHPFHGLANVVADLVDDRIPPDLDPALLREKVRPRIGNYVEGDNDRIRRIS